MESEYCRNKIEAIRFAENITHQILGGKDIESVLAELKNSKLCYTLKLENALEKEEERNDYLGE